MINRQESEVGAAVVVVTAGTAAAAAASHPSALAPILAFVGVILVALITAYYAEKRQTKQLAAEKQRNDADLEAENDRLDRRLRHERELHDLGELRAFLDQAAVHISEAIDAHLALMALWTEDIAEHNKRTLEATRNAMASQSKVFQMHQRLVIRGPDSVSDAHWEVASALWVPDWSDDLQERERVAKEHLTVLPRAQGAFLDRCQNAVGAVLPKGASSGRET